MVYFGAKCVYLTDGLSEDNFILFLRIGTLFFLIGLGWGRLIALLEVWLLLLHVELCGIEPIFVRSDAKGPLFFVFRDNFAFLFLF